MEITGSVHCLFEQSGTFKNEFIKLGYKAFDYDIQNNFGQTDYVVDLFKEIDNAYDGKPSLFDNIGGGDLLLAFFPCIYFETCQQMYFSDEHLNLRGLSGKERYDKIIERIDLRNVYHKWLFKLYAISKIRSIRTIIENPATKPSFLIDTQNFPKYSFIDKNRMLRGDYYVKPTAYWFINCDYTYGNSIQNDKRRKTIMGSKSSSRAGLCSEERSMISSDYARNFICDFIIGKKQQTSQLELF